MTREEAIKLLKEFALRVKPFYEPQRTEYPQAIHMAIEALKQEPVKHGEWKYYNFSDINNPYVGWYACTVCKHYENSERDYCPNCGADMRGETE